MLIKTLMGIRFIRGIDIDIDIDRYRYRYRYRYRWIINPQLGTCTHIFLDYYRSNITVLSIAGYVLVKNAVLTWSTLRSINPVEKGS